MHSNINIYNLNYFNLIIIYPFNPFTNINYPLLLSSREIVTQLITTTVIERNRGTASSEPWRGMDMNENDKWNGEKPRGTQRLQPQSWKRTESCGEEPKAVNHGEERK